MRTAFGQPASLFSGQAGRSAGFFFLIADAETDGKLETEVIAAFQRH